MHDALSRPNSLFTLTYGQMDLHVLLYCIPEVWKLKGCVWVLAREVEDSPMSAEEEVRANLLSLWRYDFMTQLQGRGSGSSHNEVAGPVGGQKPALRVLVNTEGNWGLTLTLLMLSSDKWADYFLISQARNCWERPWSLGDTRHQHTHVSLLIFPTDHLEQ